MFLNVFRGSGGVKHRPTIDKKSLSKRPQDSIENHRFSKPRGLPKPERRENGKRFREFGFHVKASFSTRWSGLRSLRSLRQIPFAKPSILPPFYNALSNFSDSKIKLPCKHEPEFSSWGSKRSQNRFPDTDCTQFRAGGQK